MADKRLQELVEKQDAAYALLMDSRKRFDECVMFGGKVGSRVYLMNTLADMHKAEAGLLEASSAVALRAHELKQARRKAAKESPESRPWFFWSYTPFGFCYKRYNLKTRAEAIKKRSALRQEGLKATPIYDARKEEE